MRILNLSPRYHPAHGGAEGHLRTIAEHQAASGHEVTVLTTDALHFEAFWQPGLVRLPAGQETIAGVRVVRVPVQPVPGGPLAYRALRRLLWLLSRLPGSAPLAHRLARLTPRVPAWRRWLDAAGPFDLVAGVNICYETFLEAGVRLARRHGLPLVLHPLTHLGAGPRPGADAISQFYTMRHQVALVRAAQAAIMMSPAERRFYVNLGLDGARLPVVGSGIHPDAVLGGDGDRWRQATGVAGPLALVLGTLAPDKGSAHVVEATARLWAAGNDLELVLAGTITADFQAILDALPDAVRGRLRLLGPVDDATRRDLLAACDVLVMPSRVESFGIVYLEAWLYGKAVIGADVWGIRDGVIHPGEDGLLVPFGDVPALAAAIRELLARPEMAAALGERGRARVWQEHVWERKLARIDALYAGLVAAARPLAPA